ncbi:MAG: hypothetical protein FJW40_24975, partial [Acidobacteria bacterium]|nr:hypothetical protein [Acidobacteriota bacterium]
YRGATGVAPPLIVHDESHRLSLGGLLSSRARLRFTGCLQFAINEICRSMILQRTASSVLTLCLSPGDKRNLNLLSVLQYAVEALQVKHVIVCGHHKCGGVANAMLNQDFGLLNKWLRHIKDVYRAYQRELDSTDDHAARWDRLVELNVAEQVQNLAQTSIIQRAWQKRGGPTLHGWVYDLRTGHLKELSHMEPGARIDDIYRFNFGPDAGA